MPMGCARYISKARWGISTGGILLIYTFFNWMYFSQEAPVYQNPFLLILIHLGYYAILFPFDYSNTMIVCRQEDLRAYYAKAFRQMVAVAVWYVIPLHVLMYGLGYVWGDAMDWQKMGIALLYNSCNAVFFGGVYLVFSNRWGTFFAKVSLYVLLLFCYGINFAGEFFEAVNFLYFAREAMFHAGLILRSIGCYGILFGGLYLISYSKRKE